MSPDSPDKPRNSGASQQPTASFLLTCPDRSGIVAAVAQFVADYNGNIVHAEQHRDPEAGVFFQRVEFSLEGFGLDRAEIAPAFGAVAKKFGMKTSLRFSDEVAKVAVLCSKQGHCLHDLLGRWHMGEMPGKCEFVASNHPDFQDLCGGMGVKFHHLPVSSKSKQAQEAQLLDLLAESGTELVVMARYMQILSEDFLAGFSGKVINIHHSFLPAFPGAKPYHQAFERGVKVVGVTAHYATAELDEGPIIAQDVVAVDHRDTVKDLAQKGRDLEMVVLARAVKAHLQHKVLAYNNKTVVFG